MGGLLAFVHEFVSRSGTNVTVRIPVPKATVSVSHEALGPGQVTELRLADKIYTWKIKKIDGGDEQILLLKVGSYMYSDHHHHCWVWGDFPVISYM